MNYTFKVIIKSASDNSTIDIVYCNHITARDGVYILHNGFKVNNGDKIENLLEYAVYSVPMDSVFLNIKNLDN